MNIIFRFNSKLGRSFSRLLCAGLVVSGLGIASMPAQAAVTVDQAPLIVQASLPPNITLMLDDSGSMAWDVMPDFSYLTSTSADALVSSAYNGVYFNPGTTYTPPPHADGTSYPAASFTAAWENGFNQGTTVNLTTYDGSDDSSGSTALVFTKSFSYTQITGVAPSCPASTSGNYATTITGPSGGLCQAVWSINNRNSQNSYGDTCSSRYGPNYNSSKKTCTYNYSACASGASYNSSNGKCETSQQSQKGFFSFTMPNSTPITSSTSYTRHYVAANTGDCALVSLSTANAADGYPICDESTSTQQNVANWYSYYHTRILMAKSGLMSSFVSIDPKYRVGFGSINGNNDSGLPSTKAQYGSNNNYIAKVSPFGDGSSGTQKASFWSWVAGETPYNGTPLRRSLDAVGQYYQTSQPWSTMSTDPDPTGNANIELACRQSYTILTTDGFWNGSTPSSVGDIDGTTGATVTGPNSQSYTYSPVLPYTDSAISVSTSTQDSTCNKNYTKTLVSGVYQCVRPRYSNQTPSCALGYTLSADQNTCSKTTTTGTSTPNTLADVAMKYWESDLRSSTDNEVPTSTEDPAFWQHMTTFTLGLGFTPVYADHTTTIPVQQVFDWANGDASKAISNFAWPTPTGDSLNNIADLAHAAVNGHGGFYSATSPDAFTSGLKDALKRASERVGTGASLAANSTELKTGAYAYQANYYTAKWKGDLKAIAIDPTTGALSTTPTWTASAVLPAFASRKIYTYNPSVSPAATVLFSSPSTLSTAETAALGSTAAAQQNIINYLRGDSSLEQKNAGGIYRNRDTPLGDIVDSQPIYVGQPDVNQFSGQTFTGSSDYAAYANTARTGLIYVAANDGMLHAFNADTGAETFAYIPAAVITNGLASLASTDYGATLAVPHQYFNDGELTVADVYFSSHWHSVAVGTTGRGLAKAIYALDVTDPTNISLLWERSAGDGKTNAGYIGQMTGKPYIAQVADGSWAVLMGNGYNSANGVAALLQFGISDGALTVHQTDSTANNGLAAPAIWIGDLTNGISTIAYAGDVQGRVWSFGINDGTASTPSSTGTKLFTAKDSSNTVQPITAGTLIGKDPATGNLWVFFGTGQYLSTSDLATTTTQSWYGLIVQSGTANLAVDGSKGRSSLVQRSIIAETSGTAAVLNADGSVQTPAIAPARAITATPSTPDMTGKSGWYIDLLSPTSSTDSSGAVTYTANQTAEGERIVTPNLFQGNQLIATTRIPQATDVCNPSGRGWIMSVNPFTGTAPSSSFFDLNGDGQINQPADYILVNGQAVASSGIGFSSLPNNPIFVGGNMLVSFDNGSASSIKTSGSGDDVNRVSWRELINQ